MFGHPRTNKDALKNELIEGSQRPLNRNKSICILLIHIR
jgi:hypothetical protein